MDDKTKILCDGKYIRMVNKGGWEFTQRKKISGIVGIVAVTDDGKMLLIEQFRPAVNRRVIEIPAGLVGDKQGDEKESMETAAQRELLEETGYEARAFERLIDGAASAGITDEVVTLFRATGLKKIGKGEGDGHEEIELHEVPVDQVHEWITNRTKTGAIVDYKVYAGWFFIGCR
jgi:ADP-ribose pyrophosphatase